MDDWKKFNETSLPEKEEFYGRVNMEDITDADYCQLMDLRTLEICVLEYLSLIRSNFFQLLD